MDINSATWQVAVETAGIWPSSVVLGPDERIFVIQYHRSNGDSRVLAIGRRTRIFADQSSLDRFLSGNHAGASNEAHLALEVLLSLTPEGLAAELFPRHLVEQSVFWIAGGRMLAGEGQAQRLLDTLAFLNDWHESLREQGVVGPWPAELDNAAEILTDLVVMHAITLQEASKELERRDLRPVLAEEIEELLRWSA